MEARYPASIPKAPAHSTELLKSGKPHLNGIMGIKLNQGAAAIKSILPDRLAASPAGIMPVMVPNREIIHPVAMAKRTGNSMKTFDLCENT